MYRIILVDDEAEVRNSIINKIPWNDLGFEVVGAADNGEDALGKIEQLEPDIVMTDIRMPYMDGLELTSAIRQIDPYIKVIIFSGYDDFEYAKKAINLKVLEYILKPVNVEEMTVILSRVKRSLDDELSQKRDIETLREGYRRSIPIIKEHFLTNFVEGRIDKNRIAALCETYGIDLLGAKQWVAFSIMTDEPSSMALNTTINFSSQLELVTISVKSMIEENLKEVFRSVCFYSACDVCGIIAMDGEQNVSEVLELLNQICKCCERILGIQITVGVGSVITSLERMNESYLASKDALGYEAIVGKGKAIYITDVHPQKKQFIEFDSKSEENLLKALQFGTEEMLDEEIRQIMSTLELIPFRSAMHQAYILNVFHVLSRLFQKYEILSSEIFGMERNYVEEMLCLKNNLEVEQWLTQIGRGIRNSIESKRDLEKQDIITKAIEYIEIHYGNSELSVDMLCQQLHLSPAYFSTIFKKETGKTYVSYLTELRLSKAAELLNRTDEKTYVIGKMVGYVEPNYFSYKFKKQYGVSPTKYRGK